jgi:hypothetical protein
MPPLQLSVIIKQNNIFSPQGSIDLFYAGGRK